MLANTMSRRFPCGATWTTPRGSKIAVKDEGICYIVELDGEYIGAIDSAHDLDAFASANGYTEGGTTYTTTSR